MAVKETEILLSRYIEDSLATGTPSRYIEPGSGESGVYYYGDEGTPAFTMIVQGDVNVVEAEGFKLSGYLEDLYFDGDYIEAQGGFATLTCEGSTGQTLEGEAALSGLATVTAVIGSIKQGASDLTDTFTQTASFGRILETTINVGALFSPSVTAEGIKNHTAVLDSVATMVIDAVADKRISETLANLANLTAQSVIVAEGFTALSSQTAQTTTTTITARAQAQLSATVSITVDALKLRPAQASLSSQFTQTTEISISGDRPRQWETTGTTAITTDYKKFGAGSLSVPGGASGYAQFPDSTDFDSWKTIDFWHYSTGTGTHQFVSQGNTSANTAWSFGVVNTRYAYRSYDTSNNAYNNTYDVVTTGQWVHIRIIRDGSTLTVYKDGTKLTVNSESGTHTATYRTSDQPIYVGEGLFGEDTLFRMDELIIRNDLSLGDGSAASITVPTDRWYPTDQTNILVLSHFDTELDDDLGILAQATATLSTAFTQTTTAFKSVSAASALSATASVNAIGERIQVASAALTSSATLTAVAERIQQGSAALASEATTSATAERIQSAQATLSSEFAQTATTVITAVASSSLSLEFAQTTQETKFTGIIETLASQTEITATATRIQAGNAAISSEAAVTAVIGTIEQFTINAGSLFTPSIDVVATLAGFALLESTATLTAIVSRQQPAEAQLSAEFSQSTDIDKFGGQSAALTSAFTQTASADRFRGIQASLSAQATETAVIGMIKQFSTFYVGNRTAKTVTSFGNAIISTDQAKFGIGSALITDTGDYFTISGNSTLYNGNFTVEMFVWGTNLTQTPNGTIWDNRTSSSNGMYLYVSYGSIGLYEGITGKGLTSAGFNNSQWNHIALVRNSNNVKVFVNGVQKISATVTTTNYSNRTTYIGTAYNGLIPLRGYYDEVRLSSGVRYTTGFTPTNLAFNDDSDTQALLHLDVDFSDDIGAFDGIVSDTELSTTTANIITVSSSVTGNFITAASAIKTTDITDNLAAESTITAEGIKESSVIINLVVTASKLTVTAINATGTVLMESSASLSCSTGVIRYYTGVTNAGIETYTNDRRAKIIVDAGIDETFGLGSVASIWARRNSGTFADLQPLWHTDPTDGSLPLTSGTNTLYLEGSAVGFRANNLTPSTYPSEGAIWTASAPLDTDWHHYLLRVRTTTVIDSQPLWVLDLWVDGVYQGEDYHLIGLGAGTMPRLLAGSPVYLGYGMVGNPAQAEQLSGSVAQIWMGEVYPYDAFNLSDFYDGGYVDLGPEGRGAQSQWALNRIWLYNDLDTPWTGVTFTNYSDSDRSASVPLLEPSPIARATLSAEAQSVLVIVATLNSSFTQVSVIGTLNEEEADLVSTATVAATASPIREFAVTMSTTATVTAVAERIQPGQATLSAEATVTADFLRINFGEADLTSTASVNCTVTRIQPGSADLTTTATITANAGKLVGAEATLSVEGFTLVYADIINIDPFNTLLVPQETRVARITQETRVFVVTEETRVLEII